MNAAFWSGKKVLITGHTGFKGSWLALWLQHAGAKVVGYALSPPTTPSLFQAARVADGMISIEGDVTDLKHLTAVMAEQKPEIVIHMAAQSLVRYSYRHPVETYATNVMGTVNLLEAVRQSASVRVVINVTSDKCYDNKEHDHGYTEDDPMGGFDPYSSSKGCAELVTAAYRNSFFQTLDETGHRVMLASARAGNVIGGGDWADDRLIPDIIRAFIQNKAVIVRNPAAIRPWQHVLEPLDGYLALAERLWHAGAEFAAGWNFGPDEAEAKPVSWIVEQMAKLWGDDARWELDESQHPHEAKYLRLDCTKAKARLGWIPKLSLETSLRWVVDWYKYYRDDADVRQITINQIDQYQRLKPA